MELEEKTASFRGRVAAGSAVHVEWEQEFQKKVQKAHQELCNDPERRQRRDCVEFLSSMALPENVVATSSPPTPSQKESPSSDTLLQAIQQAEREMCAEPHRRNRPDCL